MSKAVSEIDRALLDAAIEANVAQVRQLISQGANLNACISFKHRAHVSANPGTVGLTPLGIAITQRAREASFLDLAQHPEPDARQREKDAVTKRAALLAIVELLAQAGADLNFISTFPLAKSALHAAAANNDVEVIEVLLRYRAKQQGTAALHAAAAAGSIDAVKALVAAGFDANEKFEGRTPLESLEQPPPESEYVLNLGPEWEKQEVQRQEEIRIRREKIKQILRAHK